jgi:hypothetical protein
MPKQLVVDGRVCQAGRSSMSPGRTLARQLATDAISRGKPLDWFEKLYRNARDDASIIPWADGKVNPNLATWLERESLSMVPARALVIGCGLGDDAEGLWSSGFRVTAFDISESCIAWCRRRFPGSAVDYAVADLFAPPAAWRRAFDFVFEAYTLQVLPDYLRPAALRQISEFVNVSGRLLVVTRGRGSDEDVGAMPWPLTRGELDELVVGGLMEVRFEDYLDAEQPPVRRFRAEYRRG